MRGKESFIFLFMAGVLAFNWPFTAMFGSSVPAYVFAAWAAFILLLRLAAGGDSPGAKDG